MDLRPFKLYRVYLKPHNSSNVGEFSWSWILSDFIHVQRKDNLSSYVHALHKTLRWEVSRRSHAVDVKEMYLSAWCTCRAVVLLIKPIVFWRCCRCRSCLSSLKTQSRRRLGWTISRTSLYFVFWAQNAANMHPTFDCSIVPGQAPPQALRFSQGRGERLVTNRKGPWEGYRRRAKRRLARCLLPAFLCEHILVERETSGYEAGPRSFL